MNSCMLYLYSNTSIERLPIGVVSWVIMSSSWCRSWPNLSLRYTVINNIYMHVGLCWENSLLPIYKTIFLQTVCFNVLDYLDSVRHYLVLSSLQPSSMRGLVALWTSVLQASLSLTIWSSWPIPHLIHDVMLLIQDVLGLPRLRVPGMVPCIMSFSRHSPSLRVSCPKWVSFLLSTDLSRLCSTPAVLQNKSLVFRAVRGIRRTYCLRVFILKAFILFSAVPFKVQLSQPYIATGDWPYQGLQKTHLYCNLNIMSFLYVADISMQDFMLQHNT